MSAPEVPRPVAGAVLRPFGFPVRVSPSALVLVALFAATGHLVNLFAIGLAQPLLSLPSPAMSGALGAAAFAVTMVAGIVVHEASHALVGNLVGHRVLWATVGAKPSVQLEGVPVRARRVAVSAAGPLAEGAFGVAVVLAATAGPRTWIEPCALAGWFSFGVGVLGLTFPWPSSSDARKFWRGIGQVLRVLPLPPT